MSRSLGLAISLAATLSLIACSGANPSRDPAVADKSRAGESPATKGPAKPQPRPSGQRVKVDPESVIADDGDTIEIHWPDSDVEVVRILGIDTPETRHVEHNLPFDQPFGPEARAFARGAFAAATEIELIRASMLDPYGRTLAYVFLNGKNYSLLVIKARFSGETVSVFGDNGFAEIAAEVVAEAKKSGPLAFEPPYVFRKRMREVAGWIKGQEREPAN